MAGRRPVHLLGGFGGDEVSLFHYPLTASHSLICPEMDELDSERYCVSHL